GFSTVYSRVQARWGIAIGSSLQIVGCRELLDERPASVSQPQVTICGKCALAPPMADFSAIRQARIRALQASQMDLLYELVPDVSLYKRSRINVLFSTYNKSRRRLSLDSIRQDIDTYRRFSR